MYTCRVFGHTHSSQKRPLALCAVGKKANNSYEPKHASCVTEREASSHLGTIILSEFLLGALGVFILALAELVYRVVLIFTGNVGFPI